jgi:hypothetical protein
VRGGVPLVRLGPAVREGMRRTVFVWRQHVIAIEGLEASESSISPNGCKRSKRSVLSYVTMRSFECDGRGKVNQGRGTRKAREGTRPSAATMLTPCRWQEAEKKEDHGKRLTSFWRPSLACPGPLPCATCKRSITLRITRLM